jgi:flavodoxin
MTMVIRASKDLLLLQVKFNDMKNLIVYYSFSHNNEKLANYLSRQLECETLKLETVKARNGFSIFLDLMFGRKPAIKPTKKTLANYDHVIFIAPIWAGKIAMPMTSFLNREKGMVESYSFITLCGGAAGQKEKIEIELEKIMGKKPQALVELWINSLLPADQKNTIKHTTAFRIESDRLKAFDPQLEDFIREQKLVDAI